MVWRPRLRSILLIVNLMILILPLGGIWILRIYESALIRQTESELIAQGAFIVASYKALLARIGEEEALIDYGRRLSPPWDKPQPSGRWRPRPATLDLATAIIYPPPPDPISSLASSDHLATAVGKELTPVLRDVQVVTLAGIRVVDYQGMVVASTNEWLGQSMNNSEEVRRALTGESISLLRQRISDEPSPSLASISRGTGIRVFIAMPIVQNGRALGAVLLSRTPPNITQTLYGKRYHLLYGGLFLLAVIGLLAVFTSLTISRPVRALIQQAKRAVRGETGAVVPLTRPVTQEIAQLSQVLATMAQTLEQRADTIRSFASHVSHEFKTPLTAIQGAVELLWDHGDTMSEQERKRFLDNLRADAKRLEHLLRRLLDLARADAMQIGSESTSLEAVWQRLKARYQHLGLDLRLEQHPEQPSIAMATETLEAILCNLIDNAYQHGGESIVITLQSGYDLIRQQLWIRVQDNGPGISEANSKHIFDPFFTTARDRGGTGLGLAIVKSLILAHRGDVLLLSNQNGACFQLWLPTPPN